MKDYHEIRCGGDIDCDGNGLKDCADSGCDHSQLVTNGECVTSNQAEEHRDYIHFNDKDGDGFTDRMDSDCDCATLTTDIRNLTSNTLTGESCVIGLLNPCSEGHCSENNECIPVDPSCY